MVLVHNFEAERGLAVALSFAIPVAGGATWATDSDWTPASGDAKVYIDSGAAANTTNLPAHVSNGLWRMTVAADELEGDRITCIIRDASGGPNIDSVCLIITTIPVTERKELRDILALLKQGSTKIGKRGGGTSVSGGAIGGGTPAFGGFR